MNADQIKKLEEKKQQLEARIRQEKAKAKEAERKARTHRLIQVGAILEEAVGIVFETEEQRKALSEILNRKSSTGDGTAKISVAEYLEREVKKSVKEQSEG